jgi:hypothetical protein
VPSFTQIQALGATAVILTLDWRLAAPPQVSAWFDPAIPNGYNWGKLDTRVAAAIAAGLRPVLTVSSSPPWARINPNISPGTPKPSALGAFVTAAAKHYDGTGSVPAVRDWQIWNEPNLATYLSPQLVNGKPVAPQAYRAMVNAASAALKRVDPRNNVIAGALAPFRDITPATYAQNKDWGPLAFMRAMFCLSPNLRPTCANATKFDVWSIHPYTSGGPTHHAVLPNDVSLGDLPELRAVLVAARAAGHVHSGGSSPALWVTEFSWDSDPPDPGGVPNYLMRRWVPQALYQMWKNGVSLVAWFLIRDQPPSSSFYQSGLYYLGGKPKPYLEGFRFPLVAFSRRGGFYVWGRLPSGAAGRVEIEQRNGGAWRRVSVLSSNANGIFQKVIRGATRGDVRAVITRTGERSLSFSLASVPDRVFNPFGQQTLGERGKP